MLFAAAGNPLPVKEPKKGEPGWIPYRDKWRAFTKEVNMRWTQKRKADAARLRHGSSKPSDAG